MTTPSPLRRIKRGIARFKRWLYGPRVDEPLAYERYGSNTASGAGTVMELFRNRIGSVLLAASVSTSSVAAQYDYDSFGTRVETGTEQQRYGFTGREHDAESGLVHYRARIYDPALGQFLQRDPIGFAVGDLNLYAYTWNDPWNWSDPIGLETIAYGNQFTQAAKGSAVTVVVSRSVLRPAQRIARELSLMAVMNEAKPDDKADDAEEQGSSAAGQGNGDCNPAQEECGEYSNDDDHDFDYDWTEHAIEAMMDANISPDDIYDAIEIPENTRPGDNNTTTLEGEHVTAAVDKGNLHTTKPRIVAAWK